MQFCWFFFLFCHDSEHSFCNEGIYHFFCMISLFYCLFSSQLNRKIIEIVPNFMWSFPRQRKKNGFACDVLLYPFFCNLHSTAKKNQQFSQNVFHQFVTRKTINICIPLAIICSLRVCTEEKMQHSARRREKSLNWITFSKFLFFFGRMFTVEELCTVAMDGVLGGKWW